MDLVKLVTSKGLYCNPVTLCKTKITHPERWAGHPGFFKQGAIQKPFLPLPCSRPLDR
jgi:hypothetical protein